MYSAEPDATSIARFQIGIATGLKRSHSVSEFFFAFSEYEITIVG